MVCPNGKCFHFLRSAPVKGCLFGRTEELIEAINGWIKEERFLDFGLATAKDASKLLDEYVHYYNYEGPAVALDYKSPVQYKTGLGF
ncbi:MAG: IS3 family transposase [Oscillospiraceae bacterium]|nr:IS3 family transposase [Oscillospiraceae bacterium]